MSRIIYVIAMSVIVLLCSCKTPTGGTQPAGTGTQSGTPLRKGNPPSMSMIHSAYVNTYKLTSQSQLDQIRYDQFNVIYLIAYPAWKVDSFRFSTPEQINARFGANHTYSAADGNRILTPEFIRRAQQAGVKVLLCIQDGDFLKLSKDTAKRDIFIQCVCDFIEKYRYDGLEIDWENDFDIDLHTDLVAAFRNEMNRRAKTTPPPSGKYYLTTAILPGTKYNADQAGKLCCFIDWINVMTYDIGGGLYGNEATHNTPLNRIKIIMNHWRVFPPVKLCIGLANYGYLYKGIRPGKKIQSALDTVGRSFGYNELDSLLAAGWIETFDTKTSTSYYTSPNGRDFLTIDNTKSLDLKMDWIFSSGYHGVFWWEFSYDFAAPKSGQTNATHPLIDRIENRIRKQQ